MNVALTSIGTTADTLEGQEYDFARQEFKGEAAVVGYDDDYERMPVVTLSQPHVIAVTTVTEKKSRKKITPVDMTNTLELSHYQSYPIPSYDSCYVNRKLGDGYDKTKIFFSPELDGAEIDVEYSFYRDTVYVGAYKSGGKTFFIEAGRNLPVAIDGSIDYSPRLGEPYPVSMVGCYAVMPSGLLCKRSTSWSGYITTPVIGQDIARWGLVTGLAASADMVVYEKNGLYVVPRRSRGYYRLRDIRGIRLEERLVYKTVIVEYINGKAVAGEGEPVLTISLPYVYDKGVADVIAQRALDWYIHGEVFTIELVGVYDDIALLEAVSFRYQGKTKTGFITAVIFNSNRTRAEVISGI